MKTIIELAREAGFFLFPEDCEETMQEFYKFAELVRADERARMAEQPTTTENNGGKTGWPPGLLQDDCKGLSKWLSNRPDAKRRVREALAEQPAQQEPVAWATQMGEYAHIKWGAKRPEYPVRYEVPLYTSPPPRKPLTDEEIERIYDRYGGDMMNCTRAIERAHGIKGDA